MPDAAQQRLRRAQHPGHRRQARAADPQCHEHRPRDRRQRPGDRRPQRRLQHRRGSRLPGAPARRARRRCCARSIASASPRSPTCWAPSRWPSTLDLGPDDVIVTVATDGHEMYASELARYLAAPPQPGRADRRGGRRDRRPTPARRRHRARARCHPARARAHLQSRLFHLGGAAGHRARRFRPAQSRRTSGAACRTWCRSGTR